MYGICPSRPLYSYAFNASVLLFSVFYGSDYLCSHFLAFIVLAYAKIAIRMRRIFTFSAYFYSLRKTRTRCIKKSRLYHSSCTQAKQTGTVLCWSLVFCYFQFFVWCILFTDLPIYRSLNFASDLASDSPGKLIPVLKYVCDDMMIMISEKNIYVCEMVYIK